MELSGLLGELSDAVGEKELRVEHEVHDVAGAELEATLEPVSSRALARTVEQLDAARCPAVLRGAGTRSATGYPSYGARVLLSTAALDGIQRLEKADGVVQVGAGTPLDELRLEVAAQGWELPFEGGGSVGGALATAALGPRSLGFGVVRDLVLGLEVVLASGERTKCGGRVVKNVTGFDLQKLYVGSYGTLGVITSAWLRLQPCPQASAVRVARLGNDTERACEAALEVSRLEGAHAVALVRAAGAEGEWELRAEFAGEETDVAAGVAYVEDSFAGTEAPAGAIEDSAAPSGDDVWCSRIDAPPSRLPEIAALLHAAGFAVRVHPGLSLVYASGSEAQCSAGLNTVESIVRDGGYGYVHQSVPAPHQKGREVFCESGEGEALELMRELKRRFDPNRILNPGRFVGRL